MNKWMKKLTAALCAAQSVKEHSVKLSRNGKIYAAVEKTGKNAVKSRAVPAPCC